MNFQQTIQSLDFKPEEQLAQNLTLIEPWIMYMIGAIILALMYTTIQSIAAKIIFMAGRRFDVDTFLKLNGTNARIKSSGWRETVFQMYDSDGPNTEKIIQNRLLEKQEIEIYTTLPPWLCSHCGKDHIKIGFLPHQDTQESNYAD